MSIMSKKIIAGLFAYARQEKAENIVISVKNDQIFFDYHFSSFPSKTLILAKKYQETVFKYLNIILGLEKDEIADNKEGAFSFYGKNYYFKTTVVAGGKEKKIIIKMNWRKANSWRLNELGLKAQDKKIITDSLKLKKGLILIGGQENSGKSTVLNALSKELLKSTKSLCLLYNQEIPNIDGLNIVKLSAKNLSTISKYNTDVVFIDEIENSTILKEAFKLADKGYLVIATYRSKNLKELAKQSKEALALEKDKLNTLRLIIFTEIKKMPRQTEGKRDKRTMIGQFKVLPFKK
jgi:type II secretory ATPase GspE/PulE/Tfp pilus assembly ATPase PilB-like protein